MFPTTCVDYLEEQAEELAGKPTALNRSLFSQTIKFIPNKVPSPKKVKFKDNIKCDNFVIT